MFLLMSQGKGFPTKSHDIIELAQAEAKRLADINGSPVRIFGGY